MLDWCRLGWYTKKLEHGENSEFHELLDAFPKLKHRVVQYQDCCFGTTNKLLNGYQAPFLVRGWGLGTRLRICTTRNGPTQNIVLHEM